MIDTKKPIATGDVICYLAILFQQDSSADKRYELLDSLIDSEGYDASSEDEADDVISNTSKKGKCVKEKRPLYLFCIIMSIHVSELSLKERRCTVLPCPKVGWWG